MDTLSTEDSTIKMAEGATRKATNTMSMVDMGSRRRVKLYFLNAQRMWSDRGTGHVSSVYVEKLRGMALLVRSETDGGILLESKILPDTAYQKQQDKLIVWAEQDSNNLALSFQEIEGCTEIWEGICQVQGKDPSLTITQDLVADQEGEDMDEDRLDDMGDGRLDDMSDSIHADSMIDIPPIKLPPCDLSKLDEISELFSSVLLSPVQRESLASAIEKEGYVKLLLDLFHMCEDLENIDGLHHLYDVFRSIFLLNKNSLFEIMFADDVIFDVVGVLEYNPLLPQPAKHRHYLRTEAKFKEVIPIDNPDLLQKIHQTYRVQYIQDVIMPMPSVFEENMLSTLTSFIFFNKIEIVSMIQEDENFLTTLFGQLVDDETDDEKRLDLVLFIKEFCAFSQTLQPQNRDNFFKTLANIGILGALEIILGLEDDKLKAAAVDIFTYIVEYSPSMVREYILQEDHKQDDDELLINLVIEQMITDPDPELGGAVQLMGIIKLLIDPDNMLGTTNKTERTEFLSFFYKHNMHVLTAPLFAGTVESRPSNDDYQMAQLLSLILELLTFCIEHHTYHAKAYVVKKDLLGRALVLLKSRHGFLALSALRLMRKVVGLKDEFYNKYIVDGDLMEPIVEAFQANGPRYNLFNSAMIELFEYIREDDITTLLQHVVEKHFSAFENVDYVQTFKKLKQRYDDHGQSLVKRMSDMTDSPPSSILRNNRFRRDTRMPDEDEETWFEQEDDFEDAETSVPVMLTTMLKSKLEPETDELTKFGIFDRAKSNAAKETDLLESPPRYFNRTAISININCSNNSPPSNNPTPTPQSSPITSPATSPITKCIVNTTTDNGSTPPLVQSKKPLVGLVDYPDEDSDEEEVPSDEENMPVSKRPRLST